MTTGPEVAPAILVDANLLMWAHHDGFARHEPARRWWAATLTEVADIGIPWPSILAFVRISTHPRALQRPAGIDEALAVVDGWLARPNVRCPAPTDRHPTLFDRMVREGRANGNHTTDAHLAALAIEWGLEVVSTDRDFARYPGLRWQDPSETW